METDIISIMRELIAKQQEAAMAYAMVERAGRSIALKLNDIGGTANVTVTFTEMKDGSMLVTALSPNGDLRGLALDFLNETALKGMTAVSLDGTMSKQLFGDDNLTTIKGENDVTFSGEVANATGGLDAIMTFGTAGAGKDVINTASFLLKGATAMSLDMLAGAWVAARVTSLTIYNADGTVAQTGASAKDAEQIGTSLYDAKDDALHVSEGASSSVSLFANDINASKDARVEYWSVNGTRLKAGEVYTDKIGVVIGLNADGTAYVDATRATGLTSQDTLNYIVDYTASSSDGADSSTRVTDTGRLTLSVSGKDSVGANGGARDTLAAAVENTDAVKIDMLNRNSTDKYEIVAVYDRNGEKIALDAWNTDKASGVSFFVDRAGYVTLDASTADRLAAGEKYIQDLNFISRATSLVDGSVSEGKASLKLEATGINDTATISRAEILAKEGTVTKYDLAANISDADHNDTQRVAIEKYDYRILDRAGNLVDYRVDEAIFGKMFSLDGTNLTVNAGEGLVDFLGEGMKMEVEATYSATDSAGSRVPGRAMVYIDGANSAPRILGDAKLATAEGAAASADLSKFVGDDLGDDYVYQPADGFGEWVVIDREGRVIDKVDGSRIFESGALNLKGDILSLDGANAIFDRLAKDTTLIGNFALKVSDSYGATADRAMNINVAIEGVNDAAEIISPLSFQAAEGVTTKTDLNANFRDADAGDSLTFGLTGKYDYRIFTRAGERVDYQIGQDVFDKLFTMEGSNLVMHTNGDLDLVDFLAGDMTLTVRTQVVATDKIGEATIADAGVVISGADSAVKFDGISTSRRENDTWGINLGADAVDIGDVATLKEVAINRDVLNIEANVKLAEGNISALSQKWGAYQKEFFGQARQAEANISMAQDAYDTFYDKEYIPAVDMLNAEIAKLDEAILGINRKLEPYYGERSKLTEGYNAQNAALQKEYDAAVAKGDLAYAEKIAGQMKDLAGNFATSLERLASEWKDPIMALEGATAERTIRIINVRVMDDKLGEYQASVDKAVMNLDMLKSDYVAAEAAFNDKVGAMHDLISDLRANPDEQIAALKDQLAMAEKAYANDSEILGKIYETALVGAKLATERYDKFYPVYAEKAASYDKAIAEAIAKGDAKLVEALRAELAKLNDAFAAETKLLDAAKADLAAAERDVIDLKAKYAETVGSINDQIANADKVEFSMDIWGKRPILFANDLIATFNDKGDAAFDASSSRGMSLGESFATDMVATFTDKAGNLTSGIVSLKLDATNEKADFTPSLVQAREGINTIHDYKADIFDLDRNDSHIVTLEKAGMFGIYDRVGNLISQLDAKQLEGIFSFKDGILEVNGADPRLEQMQEGWTLRGDAFLGVSDGTDKVFGEAKVEIAGAATFAAKNDFLHVDLVAPRRDAALFANDKVDFGEKGEIVGLNGQRVSCSVDGGGDTTRGDTIYKESSTLESSTLENTSRIAGTTEYVTQDKLAENAGQLGDAVAAENCIATVFSKETGGMWTVDLHTGLVSYDASRVGRMAEYIVSTAKAGADGTVNWDEAFGAFGMRLWHHGLNADGTSMTEIVDTLAYERVSDLYGINTSAKLMVGVNIQDIINSWHPQEQQSDILQEAVVTDILSRSDIIG